MKKNMLRAGVCVAGLVIGALAFTPAAAATDAGKIEPYEASWRADNGPGPDLLIDVKIPKIIDVEVGPGPVLNVELF